MGETIGSPRRCRARSANRVTAEKARARRQDRLASDASTAWRKRSSRTPPAFIGGHTPSTSFSSPRAGSSTRPFARRFARRSRGRGRARRTRTRRAGPPRTPCSATGSRSAPTSSRRSSRARRSRRRSSPRRSREDRYESGVATQLDVLQARQDAFSADVARIQADADLAYARFGPPPGCGSAREGTASEDTRRVSLGVAGLRARSGGRGLLARSQAAPRRRRRYVSRRSTCRRRTRHRADGAEAAPPDGCALVERAHRSRRQRHRPRRRRRSSSGATTSLKAALLAQLDARSAALSRAEADANADQRATEQLKNVRADCAALREPSRQGRDHAAGVRQASHELRDAGRERGGRPRARRRRRRRRSPIPPSARPSAGVIAERFVHVGDYVHPTRGS